MKKFLKGFTLTELLICVAIIGIISAMGANIMKKTTEKAYREYYKTGYQNLYDALADLRYSGKDIDNAGNPKNSTVLAGELRDLFSVPQRNGDAATMVRTRNGIIYDIATDNGSGSYIITMRVPQAKTRTNTNGLSQQAEEYFYHFDPNSGEAHLIPLAMQADNLLKFYVDEGTEGRTTYAGSGSTPSVTYNKITPVSYEKANCQVYGSLYIILPNDYGKNLKISNGNNDNIWKAKPYWKLKSSKLNFSTGKYREIYRCTDSDTLTKSNGIIRPYTRR